MKREAFEVQTCPVTGRGETERVLRLLELVGPMSAQELARMTGRHIERMRASLRLLRRSNPKRIHIHAYERQPEGQAGRCIPIYAPGDLPDAPEPQQVSHRARNAKYRERHRAAIKAKDAVRRGSEVNIWTGLIR